MQRAKQRAVTHAASAATPRIAIATGTDIRPCTPKTKLLVTPANQIGCTRRYTKLELTGEITLKRRLSRMASQILCILVTPRTGAEAEVIPSKCAIRIDLLNRQQSL